MEPPAARPYLGGDALGGLAHEVDDARGGALRIQLKVVPRRDGRDAGGADKSVVAVVNGGHNGADKPKPRGIGVNGVYERS